MYPESANSNDLNSCCDLRYESRLITASDHIGPHQTTSDHVCKREIVISTALHILTINCVINLPTVSSGYSEVYCRSGSRSGVNRKSGGVERSSEQELQKKTMEQSAEQEVAERKRSGEQGLITEIHM